MEELYNSFLNSEEEKYVLLYNQLTIRDKDFLKDYLDKYLDKMISETINNEKLLLKFKQTILDSSYAKTRPEILRFVTEMNDDDLFENFYGYFELIDFIKNNNIDTFEKLMNILGNQKNLKVLMRNNYLQYHPLENIVFENCYKDESMFKFFLKIDVFKDFLKIKRKEILNKILLSENLYEFQLDEDDKKLLNIIEKKVGYYIFININEINNDVNEMIDNYLLFLYSCYVYNLSEYNYKNIVKQFEYIMYNNIGRRWNRSYSNEIFSIIFIDFIKNCKNYDKKIIKELLKLSISHKLSDLFDYIILNKKEYFTNEEDLIDLFYYSITYDSNIETKFLDLMIENKIDIKNIYLETVIRETVMEVFNANIFHKEEEDINKEQLIEIIIDNIKENDLLNKMKELL